MAKIVSINPKTIKEKFANGNSKILQEVEKQNHFSKTTNKSS